MLKPLDYKAIAKSDPLLERGMVWCQTCGRSQRVDSAYALAHGWPVCHGATMSLDSPVERETRRANA